MLERAAVRVADLPELDADGVDLAELVRVLRPRALRLLAQHRIPGQDADDLLQQALLALVCKYDHVRNPEAWLLGTLRNKCRRYWRGRRERPVHCLDDEALESVLPPAPPEQESRDLRRDLEQVLARVPERYRAILRYRYVLGLRATEVAELLGCPASTVRQVTSRCLKALHRQLAEGAPRRVAE